MTSAPTPTVTPLRVEIPRPSPSLPSALALGDPEGMPGRIEVTERFLRRAGRPWMPVMGEYHFVRDRREVWERELRKMRAGGIDVLATYVFWLAHEEIEGQYRWDGDRDLRHFLRTAARVGLSVVLRIGPWAHGEMRNGGFPDWLQAADLSLRTDDERYLAHVRRWYAEIAGQISDLVRRAEDPQAPIIGIQIENELYDQPQHLSTLRDLAEEAGLRASLFTATGWGGAQLPPGRVLPVYAGYADGFWEESGTGWPAFGRQHFTFSDVRDDLSVGADLREAPVAAPRPPAAPDPWPYVTCELGGGMATAYHRRPHVDPQDVAALALAKTGSGSAWQGYYMYHGGLHVAGALSSTQESQATGYPNDVPERDYDFFAPIGAAGDQRSHFHSLRRQHLLLATWGELLATLPPTIASAEEGGVRWAVRGDGRRGFLFANNHQPAAAPLPAATGIAFEVEGADAIVRIPERPVDIPSGAFFVWPLRVRLGGVDAVTATAQPVTELLAGATPVVILSAVSGIDVELHVEGVDPASVSGGTVSPGGEGRLVVRPETRPGLDCRVEIDGTIFVILDEATADAVWRGPVGGRETVVVWPHGGWFDDDDFVAEQQETAAVLLVLGEGDDGVRFRPRTVPAGSRSRPLPVPLFDDVPVHPPRTGGSAGRLAAPAAEEWTAAATVELSIPADVFDGADQVLLRLTWLGDVLRVHLAGDDGDELIADQFWSGRPLEIDLTAYRDRLRSTPLRLEGFAWDPESRVHVDPRVRPAGPDPVLRIEAAVVHARSYAQAD